MAIKNPSCIFIFGLITIVASERPFKFYCRFHEELQSVCLRTKQYSGLSGFTSNKVFVPETNSSAPKYWTLNWKAHQTQSFVELHTCEDLTVPSPSCFPWIVVNPIRYCKHDGRGDRPGFFDITFTSRGPAKRFTRLMPVSMYDIPLRGDPPQAEFVVHHPTKWTAILKQGIYSETKKRYKRILEIKANISGAATSYRDVGPLLDGVVRGLRARIDGKFLEAEAFFFKLPTTTRQYGLMLTRAFSSYMLYRTDEVGVRRHDRLPPGFGTRRLADLFGLPRYQQSRPDNDYSPPTYEYSIPPPYGDYTPVCSEGRCRPGLEGSSANDNDPPPSYGEATEATDASSDPG
ncbi:hypothetical protein FOZ63_028612 [Perkinsus olseni]|uniref:Uncharacterized protein n=1 Tax=Perkinsus olseni TaxID=32597 RepID=A0A7J6QH79_PEROL|nr:hypothetical protein FOZ60_010288 [Perkinsus olseni]KAF4707587.1 hypothetical protein FOZ63_028612 [Perkinsus olseni]